MDIDVDDKDDVAVIRRLNRRTAFAAFRKELEFFTERNVTWVLPNCGLFV